MKKLVILGGGYGGMAIVRQLLERDLPPDTVIYLVDRMPYQGLKTEYYALAAGSAAEHRLHVAFPVHPHLILFFGEVTEISLKEKLVYLQDQDPISYDWLVIGLGCVDQYYGIPGAPEFTHSLQSLGAARRTYVALQEVRPYGHVTIIGGGLSGVEMASELRECRPDLHIRILDRGGGILAAFPEKLRLFVHEWFLEHDVEIRSHVELEDIRETEILEGGKVLRSEATVWAGGIQPAHPVQALEVNKDEAGRIRLDSFHRIPQFPEVFVVGDCASLVFSPSAQAAIIQGKQIATVVRAIWDGVTPNISPLRLRGTLGSLGKKNGFALMGDSTVVVGKVPRTLKSGVLWKSRHHFG